MQKPTLPTPDTTHVCFQNVYESSEDSFLLLDALSQPSETEFLSQRFSIQKEPSPPLALEVGSGSGVVLAFVAANAKAILGRSDVLILGTDVNAFACSATEKTVCVSLADSSSRQTQAGFLGSVCVDLASAVKRHSVDLLIFNPPYVPSEDVPVHSSESQEMEDKFQRDSRCLALATDGGSDGMQVTNRLLVELTYLLSERRGVAYVLLCAQNKPEKVKGRLRSWGASWSAETIKRSGGQGGWERLQIVRIARNESG